MANGYRVDPQRLADELARLHDEFQRAQSSRAALGESYIRLTTRVEAIDDKMATMNQAIHQIQDFGLKIALAATTVALGYVVSVLT